GLVIASLLVVVLTARRFRHADPAKFNAARWTTSFVAVETVGGLALSLLALFSLVADPADLTPVMFAMVLVGIASNAVATHTLPWPAAASSSCCSPPASSTAPNWRPCRTRPRRTR